MYSDFFEKLNIKNLPFVDRRPMTFLLEVKHKHPRDDLLHFDSTTHSYTVNNVPYQSVTTIIGSLFEKFDKVRVIENMIQSKNWCNHELYGKTPHEIAEIWRERNENAMTEGVRLHEDIEQYLNERDVDNSSVEFQYFLNFYQEQHLEVFRTEWKIFHEGLHLAGTIDMCSKNSDGTLNIYDWKRSKSIKRYNNYKFATLKGLQHLMDTNFNHYALQLNLYRFILESKYNFKVKNMYIVCLHPANKNNDYLIYTVYPMVQELQIILANIHEKK
jgi:ATP-dependent exoDNAse (exonuclease V) beta subunit